MAAPAAPLVVEGGALAALTGALILACLAWVVLFGVQKFYDATLGALLHGVARLIDRAVPFYDLGSATVGKANQAVQVAIGAALDAAETSAARTWQALAWVVRETGETLELFAHATVDAIHALTNGEVPAQIRAAVAPLSVRQTLAQMAQQFDLARLRATLYAQVGALAADLDRTFGYARAGIDALTRQALPAIRREAAATAATVGALNGYVRGTLDRRIGRIEQAVTGAALAAGVLSVLARYAPWVRCSNVGKLGRAVCRTDTGLLDSLLAGSLLIVGSLSLEQMARELREPTGLVMDGVGGFVRELQRRT